MPAQTTPQTTSFPDFKKIVLYTGNVMRNGVAGGVHKKSQTELITAIEDTLRNSLQVSAPSFRYYSNEQLLEVPDLRLGGITPENRGQVEVTAKLFYLHQSDIYPASHIVEEALEHLKKILRVSLIDTFIVSANTETTRAIWPELEAQHSNGSLGKLGLTNFAHEELSGFLRDQDVKVKPKINQVNVGQCCNMPIELIRLAKENNVELLHNGDSGDILTKTSLSSSLRAHGVIDKTDVAPRWVVKYHVFENNRSIVTDKGYMVCGLRIPHN